MTTNKQTTTQNHTNGFHSGDFKHLNEWLSSFHDKKKSSAGNNNPKVNAELHSAITKEPSEYISSICDHLFTLHHDVEQRPFVLQFLPSFVTIYYDVLYHHHLESIDPAAKDVCSTIDTFFVSLYNLSVTDDGHNEKTQEFRIPNLTMPSIYHTPNPDHYAPTPLTQHAISKHDTKCEIIRLPSFTPFDSINGISREPILWFLFIQYGAYISSMDKYSRQSYLQMSKKLLGQGFLFNSSDGSSYAIKTKSDLPPTGRRIYLSNRIMSEILSTLYYFHSNSSDNEANECMCLLKKRAEYEMYADIILMTESFGYLHEFESQRPAKQDTLGIEIESAPTLDIIKQKRSAATARSIKVRQRGSESAENPDSSVLMDTLNGSSTSSSSATPKAQSNSDELDENSNISISPSIDQARTNISSSIGPIISTPSPSGSPRVRKPTSSLESPKHYFQDIQKQNKSPQIQTRRVHEDNQESITIVSVPRKPTIRQIDQKDLFVTIKSTNGKRDETGSTIEETYL